MTISIFLFEAVCFSLIFLYIICITKERDCQIDKIEVVQPNPVVVPQKYNVYFIVSVRDDPSIPPKNILVYRELSKEGVEVVRSLFPLDATYNCSISWHYISSRAIRKFDNWTFTDIEFKFALVLTFVVILALCMAFPIEFAINCQ